MPPAPPPSVPTPPIVRVLGVLLAALGVALLLAAAMARVVTYDEDQYLAAGLFVSQGLLPYRDFVYLQTPLYPFVLGALFKLTGGYYLLAGRLLTFVLSVVSAWALWRLVRRLGAGPVLAGVLLAGCLASPFLAAPLANSRNDVLPLCLFLLGLLLQLRSADDRRGGDRRGGERTGGPTSGVRADGTVWTGVDRRVAPGGTGWGGARWRWAGRFAAALLMGLAVEAKVSYVFAPVVLLVHALFRPGTRLLPAALGLLVAAVPGGLMLWVAGPGPMRFGLLDYHLVAPSVWYARQGLEARLDAPVRLQEVLSWLFLGGNLTLTALSVALTLIAVARRRDWKRPGQLLVGMLVGAAVFNFLPSPSWAMYFAVLAPLLACCIAHLERATTHLADPGRKRVLFLVAALPVVPVLMVQGPELLRFVRGDWAGLAAHRTALAVRAALPRGGAVATLFPSLVMDANPVLPAFASGPFVFRSGEAFAPALLASVHGASPATLGGVLEAARPAAIFAGSHDGVFRTPMDEALSAYATEHGWSAVPSEVGGGRLWLAPASGLARPDVIPRAPN